MLASNTTTKPWRSKRLHYLGAQRSGSPTSSSARRCFWRVSESFRVTRGIRPAETRISERLDSRLEYRFSTSRTLQHTGARHFRSTKGSRGIHRCFAQCSYRRSRSVVEPLEVDKTVSSNLKDAMDELKLMVRLLSIEDPFDRWREFLKEISDVWPKDVSAVDAIREQRE